MDILYVIGRGSKWGDNELRYSLRSIEKNCKNVGRIFIAGYCPSFIDQKKVTFVPVPDIYACKHMNILNCIEQAVKNTDISDEFLYSSDDHFYVGKADFDNYPHYQKPVELPDKDNLMNSYQMTLYATRKMLEDAGLPVYFFAWHGNTHFKKSLFMEPEFAALRKASYDTKRGIEPTVLMNNYWYAKEPFEITVREDIKFPTDLVPDTLNKIIKQRECISCASATPELLKRWLAQEFPNKSKWEK